VSLGGDQAPLLPVIQTQILTSLTGGASSWFPGFQLVSPGSFVQMRLSPHCTGRSGSLHRINRSVGTWQGQLSQRARDAESRRQKGKRHGLQIPDEPPEMLQDIHSGKGDTKAFGEAMFIWVPTVTQ
jgi:hypothetical protein